MESKEINLKVEEVAFIESLECKLNAKEYNKLRNIIEIFVRLAKDNNWEAIRYKERLESTRKRAAENYSKYENEQEEKNKWKSYYIEVCNKYAKLEIDLDLAKAKIEILEGEKK